MGDLTQLEKEFDDLLADTKNEALILAYAKMRATMDLRLDAICDRLEHLNEMIQGDIVNIF